MIHVENLTKYYDGFCAVDGITLDVQQGEITGLLGPNGAGKTTTLKMLTGFFRPTSGSIRVKDLSMDRHPIEIKQMIGYLPETSPFYKDMLVYDYLQYVAAVRGIRAEDRHHRIRSIADLCGLNDVMHKTVGELSKGLNQRVGLAHAMMNDPEILILDEPTQGLDPNQIVEIRNIIRKIGREKTIVLSTHILSEAEAACDRIIIIHKGRIVADGETGDIKQAAGRESVIRVSLVRADLENVRKRLGSIDGVARLEEVPPADDGALTVNVVCRPGRDLRESIYQAIKETDWGLTGFVREAKTLETVFRDLTRRSGKES